MLKPANSNLELCWTSSTVGALELGQQGNYDCQIFSDVPLFIDYAAVARPCNYGRDGGEAQMLGNSWLVIITS